MNLDWPNLIVGGIIGLAIAAGIAYLQRQPKRLEYLRRGSVNLHPGDTGPRSRLSVTWDDREVAEPKAHTIRIGNTGRMAVHPEDFAGHPMAIRVDGATELLAAEVTDCHPADLKVQTRLDTDAVHVSPLLLNPNEWFELSLVADGGEPPAIDARVAGVKRVDDHEARTWLPLLAPMAVLTIVVGVFILDGEGAGEPSAVKTILLSAAAFAAQGTLFVVVPWETPVNRRLREWQKGRGHRPITSD